jgi:DNA-binding NtrC family response regulator
MSNALTVLIVDDEVHSLSALEAMVRAEGLETIIARDLAEARRVLAVQAPIAVLADYHLPDGTGLELAEEAAQVNAELVVITGRATIETAVETLRAGASDFLQKPVDAARVKTLLERLVRAGADRSEIASLRSELRELGRFGALIGSSPVMQQVYDRISRVAPSDASVLVTGESGTGKELVAETVHRLSRRHHPRLRGGELRRDLGQPHRERAFRSRAGSFTGADRQRKGVFERAHQGSLFLDEISEMPLELQVKLLRVLETGTFTRVGGERPIAADVRIIAASNRDLDSQVAQNRFRADLLYRLRVVPVDLPPLRDRGNDILVLAEHFLDDLAASGGARKTLSPAALVAIRKFSWPGNVRELKNAMQQAYILAEDEILVEHLPTPLQSIAPARGSSETATAADGGISVPIPASLAEIERRVVLATLQHCNGDKPAAAEALGISLKTLYTRLREYSAASAAV